MLSRHRSEPPASLSTLSGKSGDAKRETLKLNGARNSLGHPVDSFANIGIERYRNAIPDRCLCIHIAGAHSDQLHRPIWKEAAFCHRLIAHFQGGMPRVATEPR